MLSQQLHHEKEIFFEYPFYVNRKQYCGYLTIMKHLRNVSDFSLLDVRCFEALNQKGPPTLSKEVTSAVMKEREGIICKYTNIFTKVPYVHKSDNAMLWLEKYPLFCIPFHTPITQYHTLLYLVWFTLFSKPTKCNTSWQFFFFLWSKHFWQF